MAAFYLFWINKITVTLIINITSCLIKIKKLIL